MECNVGGLDRNVRIGMGIATLALGLFGPLGRGARIASLIIGATELITGATRYCPVNQLLGLNTCQPDFREAAEEAMETARHLAA